MNGNNQLSHQTSRNEALRLPDNEAGEAGVFELVGLSFRGKKAWMTWYMWALGLVVFITGIYALTEFLTAEETKSSLAWALAIVACLQVLTLIKVISWQQMAKLEIMREIKRLESRLPDRGQQSPAAEDDS